VVLVHQPIKRDAGYSQFSRGARNVFVVPFKGRLDGLFFDLLHDLFQREKWTAARSVDLEMGKRNRGHGVKFRRNLFEEYVSPV